MMRLCPRKYGVKNQTWSVGSIDTTANFGSFARGVDIYRDLSGGIGVYYNLGGSAGGGCNVGGQIVRSLLNTSLAETSTTTITHQTGSPGDDRLWFRSGDKDGNYIGADDNFGYCELSIDGVYSCKIKPYSGAADSWWFGEFSYTSNGGGGLIWIENGKIWHCNRQTNVGQQLSYWSSIPIIDTTANVNLATTFTTYSLIYCHLAEDGTYYVYSDDDNKLYTWNIGTNTLTEILSINMGGTYGMHGFAVHRGKLMVLKNSTLAVWVLSVYNLSDGSFVNDVTGFTDPNSDCTKIIATDNGVYVKAGIKIYYVTTTLT